MVRSTSGYNRPAASVGQRRPRAGSARGASRLPGNTGAPGAQRTSPWLVAHQFIVVAAVLLPLGASTLAADAQDKKRVLILCSFESHLPMYELEIPSIRSTLQAGTSGPVQFYVEYMDATRFPGEAHLQRTVGLLRQKYSAIAFDLVICVDESAFGLVQAHGGELFPETPKVFCAVSERFLQTLTLPRDMTGVTARIDIEGTLEAALRIQPETQHVAVVGGTSEIGRFFEGLTRKASRRYEGRIEFTYLSDLPMAEVLRRVASMPETSIVFYLFMFQDVDGMSYVPRDVAASLSTAANRPVYGLFDTFMGEGIVGGRLLSFEAVGAQAARLGLRILRGDPVDSLSVEECPTVYMFDWRQLQRWGIREDGLPPESIVKYRRPSLWEEHGGLIVAGLCVLLAQTGTIAALLIVRARRRKMQEVLQENEANLRAFIEGTENAICIRDRELRLVLWNHAFAASIKAHFDVDLRVGMRTEDYMPREMLARFSSLQALVTRALEGKAQQAEFEFPHPDGNIHHFEIGWSPVRQGHEIIAVAEVTRDVTERKAAEGRPSRTGGGHASCRRCRRIGRGRIVHLHRRARGAPRGWSLGGSGSASRGCAGKPRNWRRVCAG